MSEYDYPHDVQHAVWNEADSTEGEERERIVFERREGETDEDFADRVTAEFRRRYPPDVLRTISEGARRLRQELDEGG